MTRLDRLRARVGERAASSGLLGVGAVSTIGAQVVRVKILAVTVGAAGLGLVSQVSTIQALLLSLSPLYSGVSLVAALSHARDEEDRARLLAAARGLALVVSFGSLLLVAIFLVPLSAIAPDIAGLIALGALGVPFGGLAYIEQYAMQQEGAFGRLSTAQVAAAVSGLVVVGSLTIAFGVPGACAGLAAANAVAWIAAAVASRRGAFAFRFDLEAWRRIARFGVGLLASALFVTAGEAAVRAVALVVFGPTGTGILHALLTVSLQFSLLVGSTLTPYAQTQIARAAAAGDRAGVRHELATIERIGTLLGGAAIVALCALRRPFVEVLLSPEFAVVADLLPLQLLAEVIRLQSWTAGQYLLPMGYRRWFVGPVPMSYAAFIAVLVVLEPSQGLFAVPLAQLAAAVVVTTAVLYHARTRVGYVPSSAVVPIILVIAGVIVAAFQPVLGLLASAACVALALWRPRATA